VIGDKHYRRSDERQPWIHPTWTGVELSVQDQRAWDGTDLDTDEIKTHCERFGITQMSGSVPVLWDFGPNGFQVWWQNRPAVTS